MRRYGQPKDITQKYLDRPGSYGIIFLDGKILEGFLATNEIPDHYIFIVSLVLVVMGIIIAVLRYDKKMNK